MELTTVGAALEIVNKAWKALEAIRERAQTSKDSVLKDNISNLYDDVLALKAIIVRLTEENADLRRSIAEGAEKPPKPEIRQVGAVNYYFVGEEGPYCQPCYDDKGKLVNLTPQQRYSGGTGRKCEVCKNLFIEGAGPTPKVQMQIKPY
jgi:hypothetical protein